MKNFLITLTCIMHASLSSCPTCIGLSRNHERPFFERKSFLAALQQPATQKQQATKSPSHKHTEDKSQQ